MFVYKHGHVHANQMDLLVSDEGDMRRSVNNNVDLWVYCIMLYTTSHGNPFCILVSKTGSDASEDLQLILDWWTELRWLTNLVRAALPWVHSMKMLSMYLVHSGSCTR